MYFQYFFLFFKKKLSNFFFIHNTRHVCYHCGRQNTLNCSAHGRSKVKQPLNNSKQAFISLLLDLTWDEAMLVPRMVVAPSRRTALLLLVGAVAANNTELAAGTYLIKHMSIVIVKRYCPSQTFLLRSL